MEQRSESSGRLDSERPIPTGTLTSSSGLRHGTRYHLPSPPPRLHGHVLCVALHVPSSDTKTHPVRTSTGAYRKDRTTYSRWGTILVGGRKVVLFSTGSVRSKRKVQQEKRLIYQKETICEDFEGTSLLRGGFPQVQSCLLRKKGRD